MKTLQAPVTALATLLAVLTVLVVLATGAPAQAQQSLTIDIYGPGQAKMSLFVSDPMALEKGEQIPAMAQAMNARLHKNLSLLPFLSLMPAGDVLGGSALAGSTRSTIDFKRFQLSKVDILVSQAYGPPGPRGATTELRAFDVFTGRMLVGKAYDDVTDGLVPRVADAFCAEIMRVLTGSSDFFSSRIAVVRGAKGKSGDKDIWAIDPTGDDLHQLTFLPGKALTPAWSVDGRRLAFAHVGAKGHQLGVLELGQRDAKLYDLPGSLVIAPAFLEDDAVAVTLDTTGNPDIYELDKSFGSPKPLAPSWGIDVSPSFDDSGKLMAFTSSRMGNPHIFLLDVPSGKVVRLTTEGKYNTDPSLSPDGRLLAFSREMPEGHRIFFKDLYTGVERQVTFGPGNDETPTWAPDGYFLAFASNRSGGEYKVWITTRHGDEPFMLDTGPGEATAPAWGRKPR